MGTVTDGGLNKAGDGQLFLSGSNTYTGPTAVNAGMLVLDGSIADGPSTVDVAVANGATLGAASVRSGVLSTRAARSHPASALEGSIQVA